MFLKVTSFKGFFITLNLPASIIQHEVFVLQAVVSNYLDVDLVNVLVTLEKPAGFKKVTLKNNNTYETQDIDSDIQITIPFIKSQVGKSVSFALTPTKLGLLDLTIKAQSAMAADAESRKLLVKPEGITQTITSPFFFELGAEKFEPYHEVETSMYNLLPEKRVPDSEYCEIKVVGDLLGPAFNNLEKLLDKPTGCGEQNMIYLTPNIYALKYLTSKPKISKNYLIEKARKNIQIGYENELKYKRFDGSFSAFGDKDKNGSSWLTAFVVKSFTQARDFINIDLRVLEEAQEWLLEQQNSDGSFNEPGTVIDKNIQGGSDSIITNTAYITISLLESNLSNPKLIKPIENAINFLESNFKNIEDAYTLSLLSYAFSLVNSFKSSLAFRNLNALAVTSTPGYKYWTQNITVISTNNRWEFKRTSSDIEMTSYALLGSLRENNISKSIDIVRWLVNQTTSIGGYSSTQNTILALQALTIFSLKTSSDAPINAQLQIATDVAEYNTSNTKIFNITDDNSLVLQSWVMQACPKVVHLQASGFGSIFVQLVTSYNTPIVNDVPVFMLNQSIEHQNSINHLTIKTCVSYVGLEEQTGMSIVESGIFSGFTVNKRELEKLVERNEVKDLKLVEYLDDNKIVFYFDQLDNEMKCILWDMERVHAVAAPKSVAVRVYDYYKPELQVTTLFDALNEVRACDISNEIENCNPK